MWAQACCKSTASPLNKSCDDPGTKIQLLGGSVNLMLLRSLACGCCCCRSAVREGRPPSMMDLWEDDVPWGNMAITALKVGMVMTSLGLQRQQPAVTAARGCIPTSLLLRQFLPCTNASSAVPIQHILIRLDNCRRTSISRAACSTSFAMAQSSLLTSQLDAFGPSVGTLAGCTRPSKPRRTSR